MKSTEDLVKLPGVVMACEFSADGTLVSYNANMEAPREMAEKAAQYIATVTMMFNTLAGAFSKDSEMKWVPQRNWTYEGGDWTVVCGGNQAVFGETSKIDLSDLVKLLSVQKVTEPIRQSI